MAVLECLVWVQIKCYHKLIYTNNLFHLYRFTHLSRLRLNNDFTDLTVDQWTSNTPQNAHSMLGKSVYWLRQYINKHLKINVNKILIKKVPSSVEKFHQQNKGFMAFWWLS